MFSPRDIPLPMSPMSPGPRRSSSVTSASTSHSSSFNHLPAPALSPRSLFRPRLERSGTSYTVKAYDASPPDPFREGATISVNQPVGSLSISPSSRDVCLASRKGLYILDLANLNNAPRFIPQGGTWQIADCQWSPHPATSNYILSTSSQKLLIWDLNAQVSRVLTRSINAHARAITDINWHARDPHLMATVSMDCGIRGWDLRMGDRPCMRLCAWGAAGTQIKWNRQHDHIVATAHGKDVVVWDNRKGSVPVTTIQAHDAKIYGLDWDRRYRHKLVTCSLDKTIKYWTVPELAEQATAFTDSHNEFYPSLEAPIEPSRTISTSYPVWRARNLPFGEGVLALPQRGYKDLEMYGNNSDSPVERFEGHDDVVKEFVWRNKGGHNQDYEDREFQLITWSKDRTLRIWPVSEEVTERVGYKRGAPIRVLLSRKGAADITYTRAPDADEKHLLPPPLVAPSGIARLKAAKTETGMTRGGGKTRSKGMDQLDWLTKVVKNKASPDSSALQSRVGSLNRHDARAPSSEGKGDWMSLKDEVVLVSRMFPRPRINFEKIDMHHRRFTISMNGPWANGDRMAFIRIHWSFPVSYPYANTQPTFEMERNPTVSPITRQKMVTTIKQLRAANRQCLLSTTSYLLGAHERQGRTRIEEESDSEDELNENMSNVPMLIRTCGATFGPNGQLVCFFPKQTVLPRARIASSSPSAPQDLRPNNTLMKAMSALSHMSNPNQRTFRTRGGRIHKLENVPAPVQAGSTTTIHDVSYLGHPDYTLAQVYNLSAENNYERAIEAKRLDHAAVWATVRGLLEDPPPPYSKHPEIKRQVDPRRARHNWERGLLQRRNILNQLIITLLAQRDVQLLALISCIVLDYTQKADVPPQPETSIARSPEQDYFTLPRHTPRQTPNQITPVRKQSGLTLNDHPQIQTQASYRNSGWSQILNPSSFSIRTPGRSGFDGQMVTTPLSTSYECNSPTGLSMPVPIRRQSPRVRLEGRNRPSLTRLQSQSPPKQTPPPITPGARSTGTERSLGKSGGSSLGIAGSSGVQKTLGASNDRMKSGITDRSLTNVSTGDKHRVSFGGNSPIRRNMSRATAWSASTPGVEVKKAKTCSVRIELPQDDEPSPTLLSPELLPLCESWKFAYADYLLRMDLLGHRAVILQYCFTEQSHPLSQSSFGDVALQLPTKTVNSEIKREGVVCIGCAADRTRRCPRCDERPVLPCCALCRLPIKGLSMACGVCNHRTHSKCFKDHFSPFSPTCPACPCHCLEAHGFTIPIIAIPLPPSRAVKSTLNRLNVTAPPASHSSRVTQSLAEHLKTYSYAKPGQSQLSRSSESGNSGLGLETDGRGDRTPTIANTAGAHAGVGHADIRTGLFSKPLGVWKGWAGEG